MRNNKKQTLTKNLAVILLAILVSLAAGARQSAGPSKVSGNASSSSPAAATAGNPATPASSPDVVVKVGGTQITESELESMVPMRPSGSVQKLSAEGKRRLAEMYIRTIVLSQQAEHDHLDASPELRFKLQMLRSRLLAQVEYEKMQSQLSITPAEINQYYADHPLEFDTVQVREFLVRKRSETADGGSSGLSAEEAKTTAESIRKRLESGDTPEKIAEDFPGPNVLLIDRKPRTLHRDEMTPALAKAAFEAKDGTVPEAVDTPDAAIVVYVLKREHVEEKEAAAQIEKNLRQRKLDAQIDDLKKKAQVWMDDSYFKDAPGSAPAATAHAPASNPN